MRTYKDLEVKYYDTKGDVHVRCSVPITEDALVHFELMQSHYCKLSFKLERAIYFKMGDFIVTDYGRFELVDNVKPKDDGTLGYSYELEFDAYYRKWKNKRLKYMPNSGSPEGTFTLTSNILTHANIIKDNLDFLAKASKSYLYDPNYTGKGSDYTFVVDASVDSNKSKVITYSNSSILDAIANIAQTFECEWWVEGNIVHFGTCENTNEVVDFKDGENIVSMSSSQSQASYANRVYAFGAARNLPSGYKQNSFADVTKNGVVEKRLMLPTLEECSVDNKKLLEDNGFELKDGCLQVKGLTEDEYVEGVTTNDDIYPRNLIKTSNVTYYERDVEDESTPEEGDYIKRTFYRVKDLTIVDADGNKTGDMAFRSSCILSGKTLHIIFQSGSLNGMDFECQFNPDGESEILRDENGSPILKDGKEQVNPAAQVFEIIANEDYGRFLPDTVLHPKDGDTFVLYNWDSTKLGNSLITSSANELLTDAIKNLKKSMIDPTTYACTAASDYSYNDGKGQFHFEGDRVNLFNKGYSTSFRASRIIGYELHLDVPFDSVKYTVGEKSAYSRLNAMSSQIEELVFNGQSYMNQGGGSGSNIYIIKSYDTTQPREYNVYSARAVDKQRLNKLKDDTAQGTITFEKVQKLLGGIDLGNNRGIDKDGAANLLSLLLKEKLSVGGEAEIGGSATFGDFIQGILTGTGARIDGAGNAEFESITSRSSIIAKELITNRQTAIESSFFATESGIVESVTEIPPATDGDNVTYDLKLKKRWDNDFTAFREQDCVRASVNTLMEDGRYYDMWFRVLSVNTVTNTISVVMYPDDEVPSGKNYPPCELARLIRWGNPIDKDRQRLWYLSADTGTIILLNNVTKPIIDRTNYSIAIGLLPESLSFVFQDFPNADPNDGAIYTKWIAAENFVQKDYEGNVRKTVVDRGRWELSTAEGESPYRSTDTEVHDVWNNGCRWRCLIDKTIDEPRYASQGWAFVEGNTEFTCKITGAEFPFDADVISRRGDDGSYPVFTTLDVSGYLYNEDVTTHILEKNVTWTRDSGNVNEDNIWAVEHAGYGFSLPLTWEDLGRDASERSLCTFKVSVEIIDETIGTQSSSRQRKVASDELLIN